MSKKSGDSSLFPGFGFDTFALIAHVQLDVQEEERSHSFFPLYL